MAIYAHVIDNKVVSIIKDWPDDEAPVLQGDVIDVTDVTPEPQVGWYYDSGSFSKPSETLWYKELDITPIKERIIKQLKRNCNNAIYAEYPIWKQMNISNYEQFDDISADDYNTMISFIASKRQLCNQKEADINASDDIDYIVNYDTKF